VNAQAFGLRPRPDLAHALQAKHFAAARVVGVFHRHESRLRLPVIIGAAQPAQLLDREAAGRRFEAAELHSGQRRSRAAFVVDHVRGTIDEDLVARLGVAAQSELVRHRAARCEQRRFLPEKGGDALLQFQDSGIVAEDVVADFGFRHGAPHPGVGARDGVTAEVQTQSVRPKNEAALVAPLLEEREPISPGRRGP
jgi:hypothetical protein